MIRTDQSEKEYQETKKAIERLNADIAAKVRNLREADDALKRFIQDYIKELTDELAKREATLRRMEDTQSENQYLVHELNGMKKRLRHGGLFRRTRRSRVHRGRTPVTGGVVCAADV